MKSIIATALLVLAGPLAAQQQTAATWTLVPDIRIDGNTEEFGEIRGIASTADNKLFVLDYKLHELKLFDDKGKLIKKVARDGAGPGEIRDANGLRVGPDGNVWVNDPQNTRFSIFSPSGAFVRQVTVPITSYGYLWEGEIDAKGRAMDPISKYDAATKKYIAGFVRFISPDGKSDTISVPYCAGPPQPASSFLSFRNASGGMMMSIPFLPRMQTVITRKGTLWCTPSHEYRLSVGKLGEKPKEVVFRQATPLPVSAAERQREIRRVDSITLKYGKPIAGSLSDIPNVKPIISRIFADDLGNVWVRRTDTPDARPGFDVFDDSGRMLATVQSPGPIGYQVSVNKGKLTTVVMDEDDVPSVVRYRIQPSGAKGR